MHFATFLIEKKKKDVFSEDRVSVWENEESPGVGRWGQLHDVNALNAADTNT